MYKLILLSALLVCGCSVPYAHKYKTGEMLYIQGVEAPLMVTYLNDYDSRVNVRNKYGITFVVDEDWLYLKQNTQENTGTPEHAPTKN
jgi:hypothetical protein